MAACLVGLAGCGTAPKLGDLFGANAAAPASDDAPETTGSIFGQTDSAAPRLFGSDPSDDLNRGKKHFRANNYGLAEQHFRKAVEAHPKDAEAWLGLAASYDRLRRFDLADRAYDQVLLLIGPTPEVLNNQGFSYMLRGDPARARRTLDRAHRLDPKNPYILNNIRLLEKSVRRRKGIE
jgi:Flp pilus assembly protein TadD